MPMFLGRRSFGLPWISLSRFNGSLARSRVFLPRVAGVKTLDISADVTSTKPVVSRLPVEPRQQMPSDDIRGSLDPLLKRNHVDAALKLLSSTYDHKTPLMKEGFRLVFLACAANRSSFGTTKALDVLLGHGSLLSQSLDWDEILSEYAKHGQLKTAMKCLRRVNVLPSVETFNRILNKCAGNKDIGIHADFPLAETFFRLIPEPDAYSYSTLLKVAVNSGKEEYVAKARSYFDAYLNHWRAKTAAGERMPNANYIFHYMMMCYGLSGDYANARGVLALMKQHAVTPDLRSYSILVGVAAKSQLNDSLFHAIRELYAANFEMNHMIWRVASARYCQSGDTVGLKDLIRFIEIVSDRPPTVEMYRDLIGLYGRVGNPVAAHEQLKHVLRDRTYPTAVLAGLFVRSVRAYCEPGHLGRPADSPQLEADWRGGLTVIREMRRNKLPPSLQLWEYVVKAAVLTGKLENGLNFVPVLTMLKEMTNKDQISAPKSLLEMIGMELPKLKSEECLRCASILQEFDPDFTIWEPNELRNSMDLLIPIFSQIVVNRPLFDVTVAALIGLHFSTSLRNPESVSVMVSFLADLPKQLAEAGREGIEISPLLWHRVLVEAGRYGAIQTVEACCVHSVAEISTSDHWLAWCILLESYLKTNKHEVEAFALGSILMGQTENRSTVNARDDDIFMKLVNAARMQRSLMDPPTASSSMVRLLEILLEICCRNCQSSLAVSVNHQIEDLLKRNLLTSEAGNDNRAKRREQVLVALLREKRPTEAEDWLESVTGMESKAEADTFSGLQRLNGLVLEYYLQIQNLRRAETFLEKLQKQSSNECIDGFLVQRFLGKLVDLEFYSDAIRFCEQYQNHVLDDSKLMSTSLTCEDDADARQLLWLTVFSKLADRRCADYILYAMDRLKSADPLVRPSHAIYGCVVKALCSVGRVMEALDFLESMSTLDNLSQQAELWTPLIRYFCEEENIVQCRTIMEKMKEMSLSVSEDQWLTLLNSTCQLSEMQESSKKSLRAMISPRFPSPLTLLQEMTTEQPPAPSGWSREPFLVVLRFYARRDSPKEVTAVLQLMKTLGIAVDDSVWIVVQEMKRLDLVLEAVNASS